MAMDLAGLWMLYEPATRKKNHSIKWKMEKKH